MEKKYCEKFEVRFHEVDFKGKAKLFTIMDYIQQTGEDHAIRLGIGFDQMLEKNLIWVVSRMKLKMKKYPSVGDEVVIKTELAGREKLFWVRRFYIENSEGEVLGSAVIYYLILDAATKFPQKPTVCPVDINVDVKDEEYNKLVKIRMPGEPIEEGNRGLYYNYIDANNHVNNARYVSFVEDFFSLGWHKNYDISEIQINYVKEIKVEDKLRLNKYIGDVESKVYFINGTSEESSQEFFQCKLTYR